MLHRVALGHDAVNYIATSLAEGGTLSRLLVSLPLSSGRITAYVPRTLSNDGIHNFTAGWSPNPGGVFDKVRNHISSYLRTKPSRGAVFEDINAPPPDQGTELPGAPYFAFDDEMYPFLTSARGGTKAVRRVMLETYSYRFLAVLGNFADAVVSHDRQAVGGDFLRTLVDRTEQLVVGAYDSDGCLIWIRG